MKQRQTADSVALLLFVIIAFVLRLFEISERNFWLDEMTSLKIAAQPFAEILSGNLFDNHTPPFYYFLLHFWLKLFPANEFGLRLLSASIDAINVALIFWAFRPQFGRSLAICCAGVWTFSAFAIYFAQEARMYPLLVTFALLLYRYCIDTVENRMNRRKWLALTAVIVGGAYTHYYFLLLAISLTIGLAFSHPKALRDWLSAGAIGALFFAPWIKIVLSLASGSGQTFHQHGSLVLPYTIFRFILGYGVMPISANLKADIPQAIQDYLPLLFPTFALAALTFIFAARSLRDCPPPCRAPFIAAACGPIILAVLIDYFVPMLGERYLIVCYPFLIAAAVFGIHAITPRLARGIMVFGWAAVLAIGLSGHYGNPQFRFMAWRDAAQFIVAESPAPLPIYVNESFNKDVLQYYLPQNFIVTPLAESAARVSKELCAVLSARPDANEIAIVQTSTAASADHALRTLGWKLKRSKYLPFENGLTVEIYQRGEQQNALKQTVSKKAAC